MFNRIILFLSVALTLSPSARGAHMMHDDADATVAILMFDGVQIIDFAAPYEVFGQAHFNVYTVSANGEPVTTAMGLGVNVDHGFDDAPPADIILVPGGNVSDALADRKTIDWLRSRSASADETVSVCNGAFLLAEAGLLDKHKATTFHGLFDAFEDTYPKVELVRDQRWVDSGKIVTTAGLASGIDGALHVVAQRLGTRRARSIALHLEYDWSPEQGFVRGRMADRYLRLPSPPPAFPDGTQIRPGVEVGDEEHWEIDYQVQSSWGPEEMLAQIDEAATADPSLDVVKGSDPLTIAWRYASDDGRSWVLTLRAEPSAGAERYPIYGRLERAN